MDSVLIAYHIQTFRGRFLWRASPAIKNPHYFSRSPLGLHGSPRTGGHEIKHAQQELMKAAGIVPEDEGTKLLLAQLYSETNRTDEAISILRSLTTRSKGPSGTSFIRIRAHRERKGKLPCSTTIAETVPSKKCHILQRQQSSFRPWIERREGSRDRDSVAQWNQTDAQGCASGPCDHD